MYRSKLFNIVLNHRFTNLDCADQYVVQMCPELTKFLPRSHCLVREKGGARGACPALFDPLALVCSPLLVTYSCASDKSPVGHGDERAMDNG